MPSFWGLLVQEEGRREHIEWVSFSTHTHRSKAVPGFILGLWPTSSSTLSLGCSDDNDEGVAVESFAGWAQALGPTEGDTPTMGRWFGVRTPPNRECNFQKMAIFIYSPPVPSAQRRHHRAIAWGFLFCFKNKNEEGNRSPTWAKIGQKQGILAIFKTFLAPSNPVRLPPPKPPACGCSAMEWAPPTPTPGGCTCPSYLSAPALTPQGPHFWIIPQQKPSPQTAKKSGWANGLREDCEGRDQGIAGVLRGASALRSWRRKCV